MDKHQILFWNVDTQEDFIDQAGKLYVEGAETIRPVLKQITGFARGKGIRVVNTCDYHGVNSNELSAHPDYKETFPLHCLGGSAGAEFISETAPDHPLVIDWDADLAIFAEFDRPEQFRNIVIRKDAFDVFAGNPHTEKVVQILNPERAFVYGVTTNVCVDKAVMGLVEHGIKVYVISDAIKELPGLPLPYEKWKSAGVEMIPFHLVEEII